MILSPEVAVCSPAAGCVDPMASIIESDHSTGNWIFSKEHIEKHTPSRKVGIDAKKESWLRKGCCTFIQDAGMRLNV